MRVVLINQSPNYITHDLARECISMGYTVQIWGNGKDPDNQIDHILLVKYNRSSSVKKLWSWLVSFFQIIVHLQKSPVNTEYIVFSNPPFNSLLGLLFPKRLSFVVYDVYPDILPALGVFKQNSIFLKIWSAMIKRSYVGFNSVASISKELVEEINKTTSRFVGEIHLWGNTRQMYLAETTVAFEKKDSIRVLIAGNIGASHNRDVFEKFIEGTQFNSKVEIFLSSDSMDYSKYQHVHFVGFIPESQYGSFLKSMDWALVVQDFKVATYSLPSRIFNYFSVGLPVLGICSPKSALFRLIQTKEIGECIEIENIQSFDWESLNSILANDKKAAYQSNLHQCQSEFSHVMARDAVLKLLQNEKID